MPCLPAAVHGKAADDDRRLANDGSDFGDALQMVAIASPTNTTRSPDTRPPIIRGPPLQDLPAAAHVEGQIEGDEQGLHQGPSKPTIGPINAMRRRSRHRGNPKCRRGLRRESNSAKQGHRAPKDRLVRDEEVEDWRYHPPCSD